MVMDKKVRGWISFLLRRLPRLFLCRVWEKKKFPQDASLTKMHDKKTWRSRIKLFQGRRMIMLLQNTHENTREWTTGGKKISLKNFLQRENTRLISISLYPQSPSPGKLHKSSRDEDNADKNKGQFGQKITENNPNKSKREFWLSYVHQVPWAVSLAEIWENPMFHLMSGMNYWTKLFVSQAYGWMRSRVSKKNPCTESKHWKQTRLSMPT